MRTYWRVNNFESRFKKEDNKATVYDSENLNELLLWDSGETILYVGAA